MKAGVIKNLFRIVFSLLALIGLVYFLREELQKSLIILRHDVNWFWFGLAALMYFLILLALTLRMHLIFKVQHIVLRWGEVLHLNFIGLFFNMFFPSAVGGDIVKAYYAYKKSRKKIASSTSVIIDRLMGFVAVIAMAAVALICFREKIHEPAVYTLCAVMSTLLAGILVLLGSRRMAKKLQFLVQWIPSQTVTKTLKDIYHAMNNYRHHPVTLGGAVLLSFILQTGIVFSYFFLSRSLDVAMPVGLFFILVPITMMISMAPSVGGLGVREAGTVFLFSQYMATERALALSLLFDIIVYSTSLCGGVLFLLKGGLKQHVLQQMEVMSES